MPKRSAAPPDILPIAPEAPPPGEPAAEDTLATRLAQLIGSESVASFSRRSGVGESLLRKYLDGAQPNAKYLVLLADAGGASIDWLAAGRPPRTRAEALSAAPGLPDSQDGSGEFLVLNRYRQADPDQKAAIHALLDAIANPGGMAWYRAGEAITRIATVFPRKR